MIPNCQCCGVEMTFIRELPSKLRYKFRRFRCDICDIDETIYAAGTKEIEIDPQKVLDDIETYYKQQEENNL